MKEVENKTQHQKNIIHRETHKQMKKKFYLKHPTMYVFLKIILLDRFCWISINSCFIVIYVLFYRLSCTILSSDHKYVAAGSMDCVIYVWERSNLSDVRDVLNKIEDNTHTIPQNKNLVEL